MTLDVYRVTIPRNLDREAWLEQRAPYVGASAVGALFGEHPYMTAGDLAAEKIDGVRQPENAAMRRGTVLEGAVASWWAEEHGHKVAEATLLYIADEAVCATLDREIVGENAALEVKTTAQYVTEPLRYWYWQAQAQMACTGYERVELAVLDASMTLTSYTVRYDEADVAELLVRARKFLEHVRAGEFPPGARLSRDGLRLYPDPKPEPIELVSVPDEYGRIRNPRLVLRDLRTAKARLKQAEHEVGKLEGILRTQLRNHAEGTVDGRLVVTLRTEHRREVDVTRLRAEQPEVAAEYERATTRRTMRLK